MAEDNFRLEPPPASREDERREKKAARQKAYRATPEVKARRAAYRAKSENRAKDAARVKAYRAKPENRAKIAARMKAYSAKPENMANRASRIAALKATPVYKARNVAAHLKQKYKLTIAERDEMIAAQDNRCLCCGTLFGLLRAHRPYVDHDHATGRIRGILCLICNTVLGRAADNPKLLRKLARYLERAAKQDPES